MYAGDDTRGGIRELLCEEKKICDEYEPKEKVISFNAIRIHADEYFSSCIQPEKETLEFIQASVSS